MRDKDRSCYRIFLELIKSAKLGEPLSSDEIAERLNLSRGTVVHHLNRLMDSGLVVHQQRKYILRVDRLERLIVSIHENSNKATQIVKNHSFTDVREMDKQLRDVDGYEYALSDCEEEQEYRVEDCDVEQVWSNSINEEELYYTIKGRIEDQVEVDIFEEEHLGLYSLEEKILTLVGDWLEYKREKRE